MKSRIMGAKFSTGIYWADTTREEHGDYKRLAHLPYHTLELKFETDCPPELREQIKTAAAKIQAMRGQEYQVTTSGQTVTLGI